MAFLWVLEKSLLFLAVLAVALMCRKLLLGGRALAAGDLAYQVDTSRMVLDFKSHGEDLNHIAPGHGGGGGPADAQRADEDGAHHPTCPTTSRRP